MVSFLSTDFTASCPASLTRCRAAMASGCCSHFGGRLGGETDSTAGGIGFELPKLGRDKVLVFQIAAAYHHERGCLTPAQREHALPGCHAQRLGGVYPYQPVGFAAGFGRKVEVIVTLSRLQVIQPLTVALSVRLLIHRRTKGLVQPK